MGFAVSWIAVKGKSKEQVLAEFELRDTGEADPGYEAAVSGAPLRDGWYLLFLNNYSHPFLKLLAERSKGCEIIACQIEEHVMASTAMMYADGKRLWQVHHQGDVEIEDLTAEGSLPADYATTRDLLIKQQRDEGGDPPEVDFYFEIPLELARSICGFKHDIGTASLTKLESTAAKKSIWPWRR